MHNKLIEELRDVKSEEDFRRFRIKFSKKYKLVKEPRKIDILCSLSREDINRLGKLLVTKPTRTISGVAPVAIMTMPFNCPAQAQCTFCPGGPKSYYGDTPKSYPGGSPAHRRAMRNNYDSYLQVMNRLEHYALINQDFSKVELIIMGGTFTSYPKVYRDEFIKYALKAMNDFSDIFFNNREFNLERFREFFELPGDMNEERTNNIKKKLLEIKRESSLEEEQSRNENSNVRCVVFCIETRPDCSREYHVDEILRLGGTRIELGIQSIYDNVLLRVKRGHLNRENIEATQLCRDSFLKVGYHMMLGLPESTKEMDVKMFKEIFSNQNYMPDALKIYPCLVFKGTELYEEWKSKKFNPLRAREAAELIVRVKEYVPKFCRIIRIQRDIPSYMVDAGVERTNLRQIVHELMKNKGVRCKCIRCREPKNRVVDFDNVRLLRMDYDASNGREIFLSYEDVKNDLLLGFLRLRFPYKPYRKEIINGSVGIREIHVYGTAVKIGSPSNEIQHRGIGGSLMEEAEKISREEFDAKKILVISGIGVKEWFMKKFNYERDGPYLSKLI